MLIAFSGYDMFLSPMGYEINWFCDVHMEPWKEVLIKRSR